MSIVTYARRGWVTGIAVGAAAVVVLAGCSPGDADPGSAAGLSAATGTVATSAAATGTDATPTHTGTVPTGTTATGSPTGDSAGTTGDSAGTVTGETGTATRPAGTTVGATGGGLRGVGTVPGAPTDCTLPAGTKATSVTSDGVPVFVALMPASGRRAGHPRATVLLSNQSDEDLCSWLPFAAMLRRNGFAAALYDYQGPPVGTIAAITGWLRTRHTPVVLMGASKGAKASIIAGADLIDPPAAVVALSAEAALLGMKVAPSAKQLSTPTLLVTAKNDPWGSAQADRHFARVAPHGVATLMVVPGQRHGTDLLQGTMPGRIIGFLDEHLGRSGPAGTASTAGPSSPAGTTSTASTSSPAGTTSQAGASTAMDVPMGCPLGGIHTEDRYIAGPRGSLIQLESIGSGATVAVFLHERGVRGMCGFAEYAAWLASSHHVRAVLFDFCGYGETACPARAPAPWDLTGSVVRWARQHGAHRVVLIGASAGGGDALEAASRIRPPVNAVVDLSGDDGDGAAMKAAARTLGMPVLYAVAVDDALCPVSTMRALLEATPGHASKLTIVHASPGSHGWDLLPGTSGGARWSPLATAVARWITG